MATVKINSVSQFYGQQRILDNIHLEIAHGEFVVVVGPSGCGKSTLLRLVAGLDRVSQGDILINDQCINRIPPAKRDIAMVFQHYALYPHMTVYQNMAYGLKIRKIPNKEIKKQVSEVAKLLQLEPYLQRKPAALSGGQRQRVAMGRAIVRSPAVFLFDEPLSNLDAKLRTEMRQEIKKLHQQLNTTSLYVTHDQTEAMTMADRVVVLNKGCIEQVGTPRELYHYPASIFVAGFMGHHPMNLVPVKLDSEERIRLSNTALTVSLPGIAAQSKHQDAFILGIRPEHVHVSVLPSADSIAVKVEWIEDMGADMLLQLVSACGHLRLSARVTADVNAFTEALYIHLDWQRASLFCKDTGKRIGGWSD